MDDSTQPRPGPDGLTHLDAQGRARMVDVSQKPNTVRTARARAVVELTPQLQRTLREGALPKGEAIGTARLAGIQAAKRTADLIPLCHPLALTGVEIDLQPFGEAAYAIEAEVRCTGPTGVEMEALTAVSVAALTLYDMCKALHRGIRIVSVELLSKSGGRSGDWRRGSDEDPEAGAVDRS